MPRQINGYKIVGRCQGGMAIVYKGVNQGGFMRAFKVVNPVKAANNPKLCQKFLDGIRIMTQLNHPNIVRALNAFTNKDDETGAAYTVLEMDWLDGSDLEKYVKTDAPHGMSPVQVLPVCLQVCDGMAYAHSRKILHLDIKPSNLFMSPGGFVRIIDFGIARIIGENAKMVEGAETLATVTTTGESTFRGTIAYASPEQFNGQHVSERSDIYSFGCTMHYLLTGSTDPAVKIKDPHFARIVKRCLEHDPDDRYQSFTELKAALQQKSSESGQGRVCRKCNRPLPDGARFCPQCGTKYEELSTTKVCPECGKTQPLGNRFCMNCGYAFDRFTKPEQHVRDEDVFKRNLEHLGGQVEIKRWIPGASKSGNARNKGNKHIISCPYDAATHPCSSSCSSFMTHLLGSDWRCVVCSECGYRFVYNKSRILGIPTCPNCRSARVCGV